jgi:hypothetical protein
VAATVVTAVVFSAIDTVAVSPRPFDVTIGASFTGEMLRVKVADTPCDPSPAVTFISIVP